MAEALIEQSPLDGFKTVIGTIEIAEVADKALVSVSTPLGGEDALRVALKSAFGADVPAVGRSTSGNDCSCLGLARDQFFMLMDHSGHWPEKSVATALNGTGYTTDQSDSWVMLRVSGVDVREALARICPLDLHADIFPVGHVARTSMEHLGVLIFATGDDEFLLMSARSSSASFLHAVEVSARNIQ